MNRSLLVLACCLLFHSVQAQQRTTPYDYPVKPGTEAWRQLSSPQEMLRATTIPAPVLKELTTEALARTCLSYPLLNEVFFAGDVQTGITAMIQQFNGLQELMARTDAGITLAALYRNMDVRGVTPGMTEDQQGAYTLSFTYLELLLAQPIVQKQLSSKQRTELAKEALAKYNGKNEQQELYGSFGLTTTAFLMARIMQAENRLTEAAAKAGKEELNRFLTNALYSNPETVRIIANAIKAW